VSLIENIDRSTKFAGFNRMALLLFRLGDRRFFGINVLKVQEVLPLPAVTMMPASHPFVRGVTDIRGSIVPVIDLRMAIGEEPDLEATHIILCEFNRTIQAFAVRHVDRIVHLDIATLHPPEEDQQATLTAVTQWSGEHVGIIDVERVMSEIAGPVPALAHASEQTVKLPEGVRVLVADDSRVARAQIVRVLDQLGIDSIVVADGREALDALRRLSLEGDLNQQLLMVISDIEMPNMDGYRLTTEIRRDARLADLYVVLHTSLSGSFNDALVKGVGADEFIPKFSSNDLAEHVAARARAYVAQH